MSNAAVELAATTDVVLVCLGDDDLRRRVTASLRDEWPVRTAHDDATAAESLDDAVAVVVLDLDDDCFDVERTLRRRETVAFETAALVDTGVPATDDRLDGYVRKPVAADDLRATVARLQRRAAYDRLLGRYYAVASDYAEATSAPRDDAETVADLKERLCAIRERLDELADGLADGDAFDAALGDDEE